MLFTRALLALPFLLSALAAPLATKLQARDIDVLAVATDLKLAIAAPCTAIRANLGVSTFVIDNLGLIHSALASAQASLSIGGVDINAAAVTGIKRDLFERELVDDVAETLASIVREVVELVDALPADILDLPIVAGLFSNIDVALTLVLHGAEFILAGVLVLVAGLLGDLKQTLHGLVGGLLTHLSLGPILGGVTRLLNL